MERRIKHKQAGRKAAATRRAKKATANFNKAWATVRYVDDRSGRGGEYEVEALFTDKDAAEAAAHMGTQLALDDRRYMDKPYSVVFVAPVEGSHPWGAPLSPALAGPPGDRRVLLYASEADRATGLAGGPKNGEIFVAAGRAVSNLRPQGPRP